MLDYSLCFKDAKGRFKKGNPPWNKGIKGIGGEKHYLWKGKNASYAAKHMWLKYHFGKANKCENPSCKNKSKRYEWAKLKDKEHDHIRENYWMLCKSCHMQYDEVHYGNKSVYWKGGRPNCTNCNKQLSVWKSQSKTGLCLSCRNKLNPYWIGKKREMPWAKLPKGPQSIKHKQNISKGIKKWWNKRKQDLR